MEFGPWVITNVSGTLTPVERNVTWSSSYHIFSVDNPCTVGFNYPGTCNITVTESAEIQVYNFLTGFFSQFKQLSTYPFYVFGESYAGKYVPYVAYEILTRGAQGYNFSGFGIGNAWTDPLVQIEVFSRMSYAANIIDPHYRRVVEEYQVQGRIDMLNNSFPSATNMFNVIENLLTEVNLTAGIFLNNYEDYSATEPLIALYDLTQPYLNSTSVKESYGIPADFNYTLCNSDVYNWFADDFMQSAAEILSFVISNTKVLMFNGADDIEVNTGGVIDFLRELSWPGIKDFVKSERMIWNSTQGVLGAAKYSTNLTFVTVNKAGHMVPFYQPSSALDMVTRWINGNNNWTQPI